MIWAFLFGALLGWLGTICRLRQRSRNWLDGECETWDQLSDEALVEFEQTLDSGSAATTPSVYYDTAVGGNSYNEEPGSTRFWTEEEMKTIYDI